MNLKNSLGVYILVIIFIPTYLNYQFSNFIKTSKALLVYDHNKNYIRKMSFPDDSTYKIFNSSIRGNIEQITFTDVVLKNKKETLKLHLSGDKPFFTIIKSNFFKQYILNFFYNSFEEKEYILKILNINKVKKHTQEGLSYKIIFLPYLPSLLGHLKIQSNNDEYLIAFGDDIITANITTNEEGVVSSIKTNKYSASYSSYFEKQGVQIPKKITINDKDYTLKKIKMNIINTRH